MTRNSNSWFAVDRTGLRKILEHRGKSMALFELVQNAWDTSASRVDVTLEKIPGRPYATLIVEDDHPEGFKDLTHAYTLFAESEKKNDPTKRGRFNLGEKLVLALCRKAEVRSTSGSCVFKEDGTMVRSSARKTEKGSVFEAEIRMTQPEYNDAVAAFGSLIPGGCLTTLNGETLSSPDLVCEFEETLPTVHSDDEGNLRPTKRKTLVQVFQPRPGETPAIYEGGIPIVETGDRYHVNVLQKVPLTMDRDNVPPSYLRKVRAAVLNHTAKLLNKEEASEAWVTNAMEDPTIEDKAVTDTLTSRFGKNRAIYDPSDREANMTLTGRGWAVMAPASLPKAAWAAVRRAGAAKPSGQIAPTPKPYTDDPNAPLVEVIHPDNWTQGMREVEEITRWFARELGVNDDLLVQFVRPPQRSWAACFGAGLDWNVTSLGTKWFDAWPQHVERLLNLLIHEFSHKGGVGHLEERYHQNCTRHGAKIAMICFTRAKDIPHFHRVRKYLAGESG